MEIRELDIFQLEQKVWVATKYIGVSAYDFTFEPLFICRRPYDIPNDATLICRLGAFEDYSTAYAQFANMGFKLINDGEEHARASELHHWYPLIKEYTPRSTWFERVPTALEIEESFEYPVFIKGTRQTAKHNKKLCIAHDRQECENILAEYKRNAILYWQKLVCREYVSLMPVEAQSSDKVAPSFEFRSFWLYGQLVGVGHYWSEFVKYHWSTEQQTAALEVAQKAVTLVNVPFLVIDLALTQAGEWIVIECNDGQESGYAGVSAVAMWKKII